MKRKHSAGYFSSYDRGLHILLQMWPSIRQKVPDATLDIYYGWDMFDLINQSGEMQQYKQWMVNTIQNLQSQGVTEHGRVGHQELAQAMKYIAVWLYPTQWTEIHCITALKTAEAGMHQICTKVAALPETAPHATFIDSQTIYSDETAQQQFITEAIKALKKPTPSPPPKLRYWSDIAKYWDKKLPAS